MQKVEGQGMVEYGLIITLIAVITAAGVQVFGTTIIDMYDYIVGGLPF